MRKRFSLVLLAAAAVACGVDDGESSAETRAASQIDPRASLWVEQAELVASDPGMGDDFGLSVAVKGDLAIVGAPYKDVGGNDSQGAAYVFVRNGNTWTQQAELAADDAAAGDAFGIRVAISGTTVIVGASGKTLGGNLGQGAAYVFVQNGQSWTQQAKLFDPAGAKQDFFGRAVALDGDLAIVGAPYAGQAPSAGAGAAYAYARSGSTWTLQPGLGVGAAAADNFGSAVALSGTTAVIGAPGNGGTNRPGIAYVFVQNGASWSSQATLAASNGVANDQFGTSVAIDGTTAVVGATGDASNHGAAYVHAKNAANAWPEQAILVDPTGANGEQFGDSVAVSGTSILVGDFAKVIGGKDQGAAQAFAWDGQAWSFQQELLAHDAADRDVFGMSVSLDGTTAAIGAFGKTLAGGPSSQGVAYVFGFGPCTPRTTCPAPDDCGSIPDGCGSMLACGTCPGADTCVANVCVPTASDAGTDSGSPSDGGSDSGIAPDAGSPRDAAAPIDAEAPRDSGAGGVDASGHPADGGGNAASGEDGGCSCRAGGANGSRVPRALAALVILAALARRQRASRRVAPSRRLTSSSR